MAKSQGYTTAEVKAGVFLTFCLGLFVAMLFVYGKASRIWRGRQELTVVFTSVTSLRPDAPVRFNGVEVGRVKGIHILSLNEDALKKLPQPFTLRDLDNLPLTESEKTDLRKKVAGTSLADEVLKAKKEEEFQAAVKEKLADRTMIELTLEVLPPRGKEEGTKRYRVDDQVRISTTLLGDTSVEIASGNGAAIEPNQDRLILGISGDFFTNLGKSIEQVKEILASVSDVVGTQERESVRKALRRFDTITERIENVVNVADKRLPATWDKIDVLADSAKKDLDAIGETIGGLQPQISKTLTTADEAVKDLQKRLGDLADEARQAVVDVKGEVKPILEDVHYITGHSKDDFPALVKNAKDLAARLKLSADKLDGVLSTGDRLLQESYPDLRRLILAFRMGAENFKDATDLIKRKPWLIINKPPQESAMEKPLETARKLEEATKRFRELNTELQAIRRSMTPPEGTPAKVPADQLKRLDFLIQELNILSDVVKESADQSRKIVLPEFQRKKGAFIEAPEAPAASAK
ncbi:MAG: MCE family protein [Planctomycetota bacterium]|nr:MCE family protein [Planctomycetota bacterium]